MANHFTNSELIALAKVDDVDFDILCKMGADIGSKALDNQLTDRIELSADKLDPLIKFLSDLMVAAVRGRIAKEELLQLTEHGFSDEKINTLLQHIVARKERIGEILRHADPSELRFRDISWRLDARVASRSLLKNCAIPIVTLKVFLDTEANSDFKEPLINNVGFVREVAIQTDAASLSNIIDTLEKAFLSSKTHRTRNFVKTFN